METIRWIFGIIFTMSIVCMGMVEWFIDYIIVPVAFLMVATGFVYLVLSVSTWLENDKK